MASSSIVIAPEFLNRQSLTGLVEAIETASASDVLVLTAASSSATNAPFCRGLDFAELPNLSDCDLLLGLRSFASVLHRLRTGAFSSIAVVTGDAIGGGVGLAAACDIVIATREARFGLPEALYGLAPAIVATVLRERITPQALRSLSLRCETIDTYEAARIGLVDVIAEVETLDSIVRHEIRRLGRTRLDGRATVKSQLFDSAALERDLEEAVQKTYARLIDTNVRNRILHAASGELAWG